MSVLLQLATDIEREGRPSLAWVIEHAPHGDVQSAVQRAWETSRSPAAMRVFAGAVLGYDTQLDLWTACVAAEVAYADWIDAGGSPTGAVAAARYNHVDLLALRAAMPVAPTVTL